MENIVSEVKMFNSLKSLNDWLLGSNALYNVADIKVIFNPKTQWVEFYVICCEKL